MGKGAEAMMEGPTIGPPPDPTEPAAAADSGASAPSEIRYTASIVPGPTGTIPDAIGEATMKLQAALGVPVWLLIQNEATNPLSELDDTVRLGFFTERQHLRECPNGAALLIDSPGGFAEAAFQVATLFRRHSRKFTAIVPRYAKSAATLLALGAETLYMGDDAELGPLDAQLYDEETERQGSALDEVQSLERLNSAALALVDQAMFLLVPRMRKKTDVLLPMVTSFAASMMQPLISKIDAVHYTQRERVLKVAEDYAVRLLQPRYSQEQAERIARQLVNNYAEHAFVIDRDELRDIFQHDLPVPSADVASSIDTLEVLLTFENVTAIGRVIESGV
jgi:hypothetical protein